MLRSISQKGRGSTEDSDFDAISSKAVHVENYGQGRLADTASNGETADTPDPWVMVVPRRPKDDLSENAMEKILENDYDLPGQTAHLSIEEKNFLVHNSTEESWGIFRCEHPSCWDRKDKYRFHVFADLAHHYKSAHPAIIAQELFPCDYDSCRRSEDEFTRMDSYRDHLREHHLEDIPKRFKNPKREQEWLETRDVSLKWWRCARCLDRVDFERVGLTCQNCQLQCDPERISLRSRPPRTSDDSLVTTVYLPPNTFGPDSGPILTIDNRREKNLLASQTNQAFGDQNHDDSVTLIQRLNTVPVSANSSASNRPRIPSIDLRSEMSIQQDTFVNENTALNSPEAPQTKPTGGPGIFDSQRADGYSHSEFTSHKLVPFTTVRQLGHGSLGSVDAVRPVNDPEGSILARKVIRLPNMARKRLLPLIKQEVAVLRSLRHRHIVQVVSTYETTSSPRQFGILISPAGDEDLSHYLERVDENEFPQDDLDRLRRWQCCLASAVNYIHSQNIRHKDIKPSNAICKGEDILLTDFGSAHQFSAGLTSSTEGYAVGVTKMYSAPEVVAADRRGRPADVYSLGCVFSEMATVIGGRRIEDFHDFRSEPIPDEPDRVTLCYSDTAHKLDEWFAEDPNQWMIGLIKDMIAKDQMLRPTATQVLSAVIRNSSYPRCACI